MKTCDQVVRSVNLAQVWKLLNSLEVLQLVVLDVETFEHGKLSEFNG